MSNKLKLATLAVMLSLSVPALANNSAPPNMLEIADPDLPGGSYDSRIEMERKVKELTDLQMTPEQVRQVKTLFLDQQRAAATPYPVIAEPVTRSLNMTMTPGVAPPVLRLSAGMLSTIVFTDAAGNPWDIKSVALNRSQFSDGVTQGLTSNSNDDNKSINNILTLEPLNPASYGNVSVTLEGLATPVIFTLSTGQNKVDVRVDARIPSINPFATSSNSSLPARISTSIDDTTLLFVDGTPPVEAIAYIVSDKLIEAWKFGEDLIVRTDSKIIFPAYSSAVTSTSGMSVYRFDAGHQSITVSKGGSPVTIHLEQP